MIKTSVVGYPRIGERRELKFLIESYFSKEIDEKTLERKAEEIKFGLLRTQSENGIDYISSDFTFYDRVLDMALCLDIVPKRFRNHGFSRRELYFAMARGFQSGETDLRALEMKKWFNTNYHYILPEIENDTVIALAENTPLEEYLEALSAGYKTKPSFIGPFTMLKLARNKSDKSEREIAESLKGAYESLLEGFSGLEPSFIQIEEPAIVLDLSEEDKEIFSDIYSSLLEKKGNLRILLQTYFGDMRDVYDSVLSLGFDALGLDFIEGNKSLELIKRYGFNEKTVLFAGVVNGKNIWANDYKKTLLLLDEISSCVKKDNIVIGTSCSLQHVPHSTKFEVAMKPEFRVALSFAEEKLQELRELSALFVNWSEHDYLAANAVIHDKRQSLNGVVVPGVRKRVAALGDEDFVRRPDLQERLDLQKKRFNLPRFPTTTIGSFPQTMDVRKKRRQFRNGEISEQEYTSFIEDKMKQCIQMQENTGLDVLVHGEFERNDMVEYFGENLEGFLFTENGWVQSYGTRGVKPPIIYGDVFRKEPMTVNWITKAQEYTEKPVKGMLTGPVTILNWSFPREDISLADSAFQIGLAISDEVVDLEKAGIGIIQVDEAALREKLPLRKDEMNEKYLSWAIRAFRLVHSGVKPETQIHTHMCYSEFADIIEEIMDMDADVLTIESARSDMSILRVLREHKYKGNIGPGVYDIHSPRVPGKDEIKGIICHIVEYMDDGQVWVNPDCGLKTRGNEETAASLRNMVEAAVQMR